MEPLRRYLKEQNLTQTEFANRIGVTQGTVSAWINGEFTPTASTLIEISEETGISIDELLKDVH